MEDTFHLGIKGLIRNSTGRILLLQVNPAQLSNTKQAYWDLPGGRIQRGDSVEDTLRREIMEETGVTDIHALAPLTMVLSTIRIPTNTESVGLILGIYTCRIAPEARITISDEHQAFDWFEPHAAAELLGVKYPQEFCMIIDALE